MKIAATALMGFLLLVTSALAHGRAEQERGIGNLAGLGLGFGRGIDLGGLGFGLGHGSDLGGLGLGLGFNFLDSGLDRIQQTFENRLDSLQTRYDEGVANNTDFFTTNTYDRIVNRTELLSDTYGLFVKGVERGVDRIPDAISFVNEDITYYNDLLADYKADTSLSAARLARIERTINRITNRLDSKVDFLTEAQTTLQTNLPTYQAFQTEISTFLTDITAAGNGATGTTTGAAAGMKSLVNLATTSEPAGNAASGFGSPSPDSNPVPEPTAIGMVLLGTAIAATYRSRRRPA